MHLLEQTDSENSTDEGKEKEKKIRWDPNPGPGISRSVLYRCATTAANLKIFIWVTVVVA